jgi:hypothetical protein
LDGTRTGGLLLPGNVLTGPIGRRLWESTNASATIPEAAFKAPLRYAQQMNSSIAKRPEPNPQPVRPQVPNRHILSNVRRFEPIVALLDPPRTSPLLGSYPSSINPAGAITGHYCDTSLVAHGFLRAHEGTITEFDPPSTIKMIPLSINPAGAIYNHILQNAEKNRRRGTQVTRHPVPQTKALTSGCARTDR